ncbi:hypothetical protein SERLADRAFT_458146 [Serpula lacrymans var. lacrymans S7.9]|uniref:HECT-type E3 ubiquitin transferase E3D n=1 Tax=Serpula lacrymans var. lacrymans (strain S7.9) TaxID=578457 RepID=F8NJE3_SERL9|nr:uncharacterized protein SERLADRAFT_458146 [Serpula lacrymans var. lacrymans S7.9]EGO29841.1 hypothetical protein SERLADRAFT_458146 [Serpula lacrymans var. lacrymans S7.9]
MLDLLGKASDRRLIDQSVILDGPIKVRLEKARQQDREQRDAFVEKLMQHSESGRYHTQDAVLQVPKVRDLNGLVSLPEFIRESMPQEARVLGVDAIARSSSEVSSQALANEVAVRKKGSRNRSMSAPSLSWLRPSSRSGHPADSKTKKSPSRPGSSGKGSSRQAALDISYIAEHHETLQHVLVFVSVGGLASNTDLSAEVLPTVESGTEGDLLIIRNDAVSSPPLTLPARIASGVQDIKLRNDYYELKLSVVSTSRSQSYDDRTSAPLMDATQLSSLKPTNFICTSCSLPLVHSSAIVEYKDLPSEHWEELVDAWMCHTDQTLHEQITKHGRGFWPEQGQALVGGSYVLFEDTSVVKSTITTTERPKRAEDWRLVRCMCGAMVGRCQERHEDGGVITMYRLLKYAIRPVSPTAKPQRVPLSAFIVEDMSEYVQAHATYRFVISDEEDERPRLLMWLFKPSIRLSYMLPTEYFLKKNGSIHAAKVLYKVIRPSTKSTDLKDLLNKYPGFPQAEYLFYPLDICRRLAGLLRESTRSYPESMRTMTGLDVGWLHRA